MNKPAPRLEYRKHIDSLAGSCAFCADQEGLIIKKFIHWDWVFAAFPYRKYHTILVPRRHIINFFDLEESELLEFILIIKEVEDVYKKSGIVSRESLFGDQMYYA
jgi:diadenosine tetraphosphate (Ap4A) HIT family hydrolase